MSKPVENPTRLSGLSADEDALGVGRMFRNARELPDEELPMLRWKLRTSQRMRAIRPRLYLRVALVVGLAFCVGGVVGAGVWPFWPKKARVVAPVPNSAASTPKANRPRPASSSPAAPPVVEPVAVEAEPRGEEPEVAAPAKHRGARRIATVSSPPSPSSPPVPAEPSPVAPPPAKPSSIAAEQALLGQAVKALRDGHDAHAALALLAQHAERFPHGPLASEETMLRIEALLALGRHDEALSFLDQTQLGALPNRQEQLVVRGELRAAKRRWREAKQDFDDALGAGRGLPAASAKLRNIQERALWGRASARSRLGDQEGARADLGLYLRQFPDGRFAGPASSFLKGTP